METSRPSSERLEFKSSQEEKKGQIKEMKCEKKRNAFHVISAFHSTRNEGEDLMHFLEQAHAHFSSGSLRGWRRENFVRSSKWETGRGLGFVSMNY